jgi:hypothetical protein
MPNISGNIVLNSADGDLFVTRDLIWNSGATVSTTLSTVDIVVGRNMTFNEGSNVNFTQGIIHFSGTVNASLVNHSSATQINNLSKRHDISRILQFWQCLHAGYPDQGQFPERVIPDQLQLLFRLHHPAGQFVEL